VQIQYNPSFLLGDVLRLTLPENFIGVHYAIQGSELVVGSEWFESGTQLSIWISYNPDRVSVDVSTFVSSHEIISLIEDVWMVSVVVDIVDPTIELFRLWFVSDEEYHIVVSEAWVLRGDITESVAIQRLY